MKILKTYFYSTFLSIAFLAFSTYRSFEIHQLNQDYQLHMQQHVEVLNFEDRLFNATEWSLLLIEKAFHFVDDTEWNEKEQIAVHLLLEAENDYSLILEKSIEIGVFAFSIIFLSFLINFKNNFKKHLILPFFIVCTSFLYLGITTPMLEISASNTDLKIPIALDLSSLTSPIEKGLEYFDEWTGLNTSESAITDKLETYILFEGKIYYYYQSKSVLQLISILFKENNLLVGISILLFSIVLPILKMTLTFILSVSKQKNKSLEKILTYIGKWSMADVFVASCFLAFLSFSNMNVGIDTESKTLVGIYFFFSYVILSMIMGSLKSKSTPTTI